MKNHFELALERLLPGVEIAWVTPSRFRGPPFVEVMAWEGPSRCSVGTQLTASDTPSEEQLVAIAELIRQRLGVDKRWDNIP